MAKDGIIQEAKFFSQTKDYIIHDITSVVRKEGWTFNYDIVEDRIITNEVGEIMLKIGRKLLNHSTESREVTLIYAMADKLTADKSAAIERRRKRVKECSKPQKPAGKRSAPKLCRSV